MSGEVEIAERDAAQIQIAHLESGQVDRTEPDATERRAEVDVTDGEGSEVETSQPETETAEIDTAHRAAAESDVAGPDTAQAHPATTCSTTADAHPSEGTAGSSATESGPAAQRCAGAGDRPDPGTRRHQTGVGDERRGGRDVGRSHPVQAGRVERGLRVAAVRGNRFVVAQQAENEVEYGVGGHQDRPLVGRDQGDLVS